MAAPIQKPDESPSLNPVHIVAAILLLGETFRKTIPQKEMESVAKRMVQNARLIVDAAKN